METGQLELNDSRVSPEQDLRVLLFYEDTETGLRARNSWCIVENQAQCPGSLSPRLWRSDLLKATGLRERAALEAAAADVIIVSLHGREGLTREVREWLCRWLECKHKRPYALGLLLDTLAGDGQAPNPVIAYVKMIAQAGGADLFLGFCDTLQPEPQLDAQPRAPGRFGLTRRRADEWLTPARRAHWGINE